MAHGGRRAARRRARARIDRSAASFASPAESPGYLLWRASLQWQRQVSDTLLNFGLTHTRFVLLAVLWWWGFEHDEPPTQRQLGEAAGMDPMLTSQVARALERRDLLGRTPDPEDARALRLHITPYGRRIAARAIAAVEETDDGFFAAVDDHAVLVSTLRRLGGVEPEPAS